MGKYSFDAVIFDLDGVITQTALVHARAWKLVFDEYLCLREKRNREKFREFTHDADYLPFVDGKPREEGVKSFLESRGINIPDGDAADAPDKETVWGIGNKKDVMFCQSLVEEGAPVYSSTIKLIRSLKQQGIRIGVASSSQNCQAILKSAGIEHLFETRVDGGVCAALGLRGKPEPDIFVRAAANLGAVPAKSVVVEDAVSGVAAGRNGAFGLVLGVARRNNKAELAKNGADIVVRDLAQINIKQIETWFLRRPRSLFKFWDKDVAGAEAKRKSSYYLVNPCYCRPAKAAFTGDKRLVFFLDYDGTLAPIAQRPELAVLPPPMKAALEELCRKYTVAVVSGRMRQEVKKLVGIKEIFYAGSHGFDIEGPGVSMVLPAARAVVPLVARLVKQLGKEVGDIPGVLIEEKKFSVTVHYRLVAGRYVPKIKNAVSALAQKYKPLCLMAGRKVFELLPAVNWDKGRAIRWMMQALGISWFRASVVYIGDDITDESAFRTVRSRGTAILVSALPKESAADFWVSSTRQVKKLFEHVIAAVSCEK